MPTRLRVVARFGLLLTFALLLLVAALGLSQQFPAGQDWTHYVRIGAYGLKTDNAEADRPQRPGEQRLWH